MKDYIDYMDNISVDPALHEKIMNRVARKPTPLYRSRTALRWAGIAACAAVLLFCAWMMPAWFGIRSDDANQAGGAEYMTVQFEFAPDAADDSGGTDFDNFNSNDEPAPQAGGGATSGPESMTWYPLTLNRADGELAADRALIPGHFWYALTGEQRDAVLPPLPFGVAATAHYYGDGTLFNVTAYELEVCEPAMFAEYYYRTEIQIAPGEIVDCVVYNYEAEASYVYGVPVVAGVYGDGDVALYVADFKLGDIAYRVKLHDSGEWESGLDRLTEIVNIIISNGEPDLSVLESPVIPELRDERLTLGGAREDPDFGAYVPRSVPSRFGFESARRFLNQDTDGLFVHWTAGLDHISWHITVPTDHVLSHVVRADERERYDRQGRTIYEIRLEENLSYEELQYLGNPVFLAEELTLDMVRATAYWVDSDLGDTPGWRMEFSVLYDGAAVRINAKGVSPEQVWEMLAGLG